VEAMIQAHTEAFIQAGYPATVLAGSGEDEALSPGVSLIRIPEMDTRYSEVTQMSSRLEQGEVPPDFDNMVNLLIGVLTPTLSSFDIVIIHNLFTKHFNLSLTAALHILLDAGKLGRCIAWCHNFT
jgi:hypothetical protein